MMVMLRFKMLNLAEKKNDNLGIDNNSIKSEDSDNDPLEVYEDKL